MIKIIHTGDWHLRDRQYGSDERGQDFTDSALRVVALAAEMGVTAICNCGDMLNSKRPSSKNIDDIRRIDDALKKAGIPMYCISGNHDRAEPTWLQIAALDNEASGVIDLDNRRLQIPGTALTVHGLPFMGAAGIREVLPSMRHNSTDILMSHELLKEFAAFPPDGDALSIADYANCEGPVLLGDIHSQMVRKLPAGNYIGYPGSIEFCEQREPVEKSVTILQFDENGTCKGHTVQPIKTRAAICYKIETEEMAKKVAAELPGRLAEKPIILVRYHPDLHTVPAMLMTVCAGAGCILRCASLPRVASKMLFDGSGTSAEELRKPEDFIADFLPPGTPLFDVCKDLANPEVDVRQLIDTYVGSRLGEKEPF